MICDICDNKDQQCEYCVKGDHFKMTLGIKQEAHAKRIRDLEIDVKRLKSLVEALQAHTRMPYESDN